MANAAFHTIRETARRLRDENGLSFSIATICEREQFPLAPIPQTQVITQQVASDLVEKHTLAKYPLVYVYCDRLQNTLREKFRTFSGLASMTTEVRVSHEHLPDVEKTLQLYVEAVTNVLDLNRGTWSDGLYYAGGYEVQFGAIKQG